MYKNGIIFRISVLVVTFFHVQCSMSCFFHSLPSTGIKMLYLKTLFKYFLFNGQIIQCTLTEYFILTMHWLNCRLLFDCENLNTKPVIHTRCSDIISLMHDLSTPHTIITRTKGCVKPGMVTVVRNLGKSARKWDMVHCRTWGNQLANETQFTASESLFYSKERKKSMM